MLLSEHSLTSSIHDRSNKTESSSTFITYQISSAHERGNTTHAPSYKYMPSHVLLTTNGYGPSSLPKEKDRKPGLSFLSREDVLKRVETRPHQAVAPCATHCMRDERHPFMCYQNAVALFPLCLGLCMCIRKREKERNRTPKPITDAQKPKDLLLNPPLLSPSVFTPPFPSDERFEECTHPLVLAMPGMSTARKFPSNAMQM